MRVSMTLSCGCAFRPSQPIPNVEAAAHPGTVVICDKHDEWAVVTRVTTRLVATSDTLRALLLAADVDDLSAEYVAQEQAD